MKTKFPWNNKMKQNAASSTPLFWFVLLLILLTLIRAFPALAFQNKGNENTEQLIVTMKEKLILSQDQASQIRSISKEDVESRSEIYGRYRSQNNIDRSAMRTETLYLRTRFEVRLAGVLSDRQMQMLKDY